MKLARWLAAVAVVAVATHLVLLHFGARLVMGRVYDAMTAFAGVNAPAFPPRPTAETDRIVRSSPDLLYSICAYDLTDGPVEIAGVVPPGTYWSASFYDMNTDNFRVVNDREAASRFAFRLVRAGEGGAKAGAETVESPTARGVVLFRTLISDEKRLGELDAARREVTCGRAPG